MAYFLKRGTPLLERFERTRGGCWQWKSGRNSWGYGIAYVEGSARPAHRVVYEAIVGPIPVGLELDHLCRNRGCVNPAHLEPVTRSENLRRGASGLLRSACPNGHSWPENVSITRRGFRRCVICAEAKEARRRHRYQQQKRAQ